LLPALKSGSGVIAPVQFSLVLESLTVLDPAVREYKYWQATVPTPFAGELSAPLHLPSKVWYTG